jgi:Zn-dependent oligopeptidase
MRTPSTSELVSAYIALRDERAKIKGEYEEADAKLVNSMEHLEQAMLSICNEIKADSIKTEFGTMIRRVNERYYCTDWDNFKDYVKENDAIDLLERRIHQGNFRQHMEEIKEHGLPPGVNVMREYGITVRKAS